MLLLNNTLVPTATLSLPNRGLSFGDGFFETLIFINSRLRLAADHCARMQQAATALHLKLPAALAKADALETHSIHSPLSFCKGPQAWIYVRAAHERQRRGLDEIILCDAAGHVAEAGAAAIFWERNGVLFTPALSSGCVAGVRRAQVLRATRAAGVECREGLFTREELLAADAIFTANVASIRPMLSVATTAFRTTIPDFIEN